VTEKKTKKIYGKEKQEKKRRNRQTTKLWSDSLSVSSYLLSSSEECKDQGWRKQKSQILHSFRRFKRWKQSTATRWRKLLLRRMLSCQLWWE
jgi:hypothetical protein